jgi:cyclophilin family peptidyl-prolyl cis-trans isomerase
VTLAVALSAAAAVAPVTATQARPAKPPAAGPVLVLETAKGAIEITFYQAEAPKSVDHIVALIRGSFYRGQRFHRVDASLAQFGDRRSRDMTLRASWGTGGSGAPINVFEVSKKRTHVRGAVALAHSGNPMLADSQLYIMKRSSPSLDGKHAVIGQVTAGMAVVDRIAVEDLIKNAFVKGEGPK